MKNLKNVLATLALLAVLSVSAFAATLTSYTSPKSDFTILSPSVFVIENETSKDASGQPISLSTYTADEANGNKLVIVTGTYQYLVDPTLAAKSAAALAARAGGEIYFQGDLNGATVSFINVPGGRVAFISKAKGSELFEVAFFAPDSEIQKDADEVTAIVTSFSTDVVKADKN